MTRSQIVQAALLKSAAWELSDIKDGLQGTFDKAIKSFRNMDPEWRRALIGIAGGGLLGGATGLLSGGGFGRGALTGAALGGLGGYFGDQIAGGLKTLVPTPEPEPSTKIV